MSVVYLSMFIGNDFVLLSRVNFKSWVFTYLLRIVCPNGSCWRQRAWSASGLEQHPFAANTTACHCCSRPHYSSGWQCKPPYSCRDCVLCHCTLHPSCASWEIPQRNKHMLKKDRFTCYKVRRCTKKTQSTCYYSVLMVLHSPELLSIHFMFSLFCIVRWLCFNGSSPVYKSILDTCN